MTSNADAGRVASHGEWDKAQQRYADGCKSGTPEHIEGRGTSPVDAPEQHDEQCEAEFITGPMAYSPCACAERAAGRSASRSEGTEMSGQRHDEWFRPNFLLAALLVVGLATVAWCIWRAVQSW